MITDKKYIMALDLYTEWSRLIFPIAPSVDL